MKINSDSPQGVGFCAGSTVFPHKWEGTGLFTLTRLLVLIKYIHVMRVTLFGRGYEPNYYRLPITSLLTTLMLSGEVEGGSLSSSKCALLPARFRSRLTGRFYNHPHTVSSPQPHACANPPPPPAPTTNRRLWETAPVPADAAWPDLKQPPLVLLSVNN